jgi:hypothetical protein
VGLTRRSLSGALCALTAAAGAWASAQVAPAPGISHIRLSDSRDDVFLGLGGELRERFEYVRNGDWDEANPPDGYLLQRYMLHADLRLGPHLRLFAHLKSGLEDGRVGGPGPADEDRFAVHEAFLDLGLTAKTSLLVGRQELAYGSSRLVSIRDGPNVRRSFDGARVVLASGGRRFDAFVVKPVKTSPGASDDKADHTVTFWGTYAVLPLCFLTHASLDAYYLGLDRKHATFDQGSGREQRHSIGTRLWRKQAPWDYNFELVYQWGRFGGAPIRGWTFASDTGLTLRSVALRPRFGLKADVTSGDHDPADPALETFNPLFPRGSYFGEAALIGPLNHVDLHPSIDLKLRAWLIASPSIIFFWRESRGDGLYSASGTGERSGRGTSQRYVGSQAIFQLTARVSRHVDVVADYEHFFAGPYLRESGSGDDLAFFASWVGVKF